MTLKPIFLLVVILMVSAVALTACVSQAPASPPGTQVPALKTVRVAYQPTTSFGPVYIAMEEGFFAKQGINVEFEKTLSSAAALPLLLNGDLAVSGGPLKIGLVNVIGKGEHIRIVADKGRVSPGSCTVYALMVRKDLFDKGFVTNVSGLKGRKIAARDSDYDLYRALAMGNLTTGDVEIVDMDFATTMTAFKNGAIDAGFVTEPYVTQAADSGSAVVLVPGQDFIPGWPIPLYYGPAFLDKDPELGRKFMVAYLQGVKQYNEGKTGRNLEIMANYTHMDRDLLNRTCWYTIAGDGNLPEKPVREYVDWMYTNKKIAQNLNDDQLFDARFITYANGVLQNSST
jgi:NitT/TauT family transport system substrate-binding protein